MPNIEYLIPAYNILVFLLKVKSDEKNLTLGLPVGTI